MDTKDLENKINKLESEQSKIKEEQVELKNFVNTSITPIQIGIAEIKVMLKERLEQDNLKNDLLEKDIKNHEARIKKLEDNHSWLWKTVAGSIITLIVSIIVFVIKLMK